MSTVETRLRQSGLRPTAQRMAIACHLFEQNTHRHVTAELLHDELQAKDAHVALATVYNTLHQFTDAGLLRQVNVEPGKSYFDTNIGQHYHVYDEETGELSDIAKDRVSILVDGQNPDLGIEFEGRQLGSVDVVLRLKPRN